ncbi:hypothetical protein [Candidatus Protofrankia californiensis]|uniref:hypothetical protein n=1 Tax=Candidatus Protofrankia californiensis TaxID=1839754 RepID=UPI0010415FD9|nr:hypothetical protein [Candidatus Protofrankia californiensis]
MRQRWLPVRVDDYDAWLADVFLEAAQRLGVAPCTPATSVADNIGGPVLYKGERVWLRVAPFHENGMDREAWTGIRDAAVLSGIHKPTLLGSVEWAHTQPVNVPVCADLMTLATDPVAAPGSQYLATPITLSPRWLGDLRASLDALATHPTDRTFWAHCAERYRYLLHAVYGRPLPSGIEPTWGSTEHLDLHWGNVTVPNLMILDWEHWGVGVTGYGAARLYCTALAVPEVAERVYATFADVLDSPSGRYAQLVAAADILVNVAYYEDTVDLCSALHQLAKKILG